VIVYVAAVIGAVIWVVLWALGAKALDAFLPFVVLVVHAAAIQIFAPHIRRFTRREEPAAGI
jgi:hypothetical protein